MLHGPWQINRDVRIGYSDAKVVLELKKTVSLNKDIAFSWPLRTGDKYATRMRGVPLTDSNK